VERKRTKTFRFGRLNLHVVPILVWLVALAGVIFLFYHRSERVQVLGITQGRMYQVSAPVDSRLKIVAVELFEAVNKGQVLATLDDAQLNAQIASIYAEIEHLKSQMLSVQDTMQAEAANMENDEVISKRQYDIDVENARIVVLEKKTLIETDKISLEDLSVEVKIATELLGQDAISPYELQKAEVLYNVLAKKIELNQQLLTQAEQDLEQARQRREEFSRLRIAHPSIEIALETIQKQINVQERLIDELSVQREVLKITSPVDGIVTQIQVNSNQAALRRPGEDVLRRPGEFVLAGDPILVIAEKEPTEIIAYIGQEQLAKVKETMVVQIVKNTEPKQVASSQVISLSPTMELMPQRLWRNPNVAQWGRPILIKIPPGLKLLPGETVGIRGL
jgi:multidrug resistance efflux pump